MAGGEGGILAGFFAGESALLIAVKTLDRYISRQVMATLGMTVFVFTLVLLLGNVLKQIQQLVISRQATLGLALHAILLLIPYVLAFALPMGMLTATLLVFGRFSADQELTAARASGISLASLVAPVLGLSVLVSGFCAWLNMDIAPASRVAYLELLRGASLQGPGTLLQSDQYMQFGKYTVYARKVQRDGTNLDDVMITEWDVNNQVVFWCKAPRAEVVFDNTNKQITLYLKKVGLNLPTSATHDSTGWTPGVSGEFPLPPVPYPKSGRPLTISISDMTFGQLREKLAWLERGSNPVPPPGATRADLLKAQQSIRAAAAEITMPVLVYLNQQVAFSFACIGFTLVGIPLGVRGHRRETSVGVAMALVLVLVYYSFMVLGQAWENHPERFPCLIIWLPNFIFQAVGAVLLWRLNRSVF
jgi:lipopolysaccharide export system permease protein